MRPLSAHVLRSRSDRGSIYHLAAKGATSRLLWLCGSGQTLIVIFVLTGPVHNRTDIQALHPCVCRTIIEYTEVRPVPWQRTRERE